MAEQPTGLLPEFLLRPLKTLHTDLALANTKPKIFFMSGSFLATDAFLVVACLFVTDRFHCV
jgi:hypothetical protein